jgi:putative two-component system response regulator
VTRDRILYVDDDAPVRNLAQRILERRGYRCDVAAGAAEATACLAGDDYAVVLTDVDMPGQSGLELLKEVRWSHPALAVVMVTAYDRAELYEAALDLGCYGYILKPYEASELVIGVAGALRRRRLELEARGSLARLEEAVAVRTAALERSTAALARSQTETIRRLSRALEWRDSLTGEHVERVSELCDLVARHLGLGAHERELIRVASPLHDVGKIGVPDRILRKPGPLTRAERAAVERHPQIGYEILGGSDSELLEHAATISLTHHERWDGTGYPRRLAGAAIPLAGRVVAVADVFDALTSDRPYRAALPYERALALITGARGLQFDPDVVDALLAALPELEQSESLCGAAA